MKLTFKPAPELSHASESYPSDFFYTYDVAYYKGVEIRKVYCNGNSALVHKYIVRDTRANPHKDTIKSICANIDRFCK